MGTDNLDFLVQLAALGTSGVCIFAIFWIGVLLRNDSKSQEHHKTLRYYMNITVVIAAITASSGIANAMIKQTQISQLQERNDNLTIENQSLMSEVIELGQIADAIDMVLSSKEATELRNPNPELRTYIDLLRNFVNQSKENNE